MSTWWKIPFAARVALLVVLVTVTMPGRAAIVSYEWVAQSGSGGSGILTLDSLLISDPANFSGAGFVALSALDYTFGNGVAIQKSDIQFFQGFPFSAAGGQLTNNFQFSTNTVALSFSLASNAGISSNQIVTPGPAITDAGNWRLAAPPAEVPIPPALSLLAAGILAVFGWQSPRLIGRNRHSTL